MAFSFLPPRQKPSQGVSPAPAGATNGKHGTLLKVVQNSATLVPHTRYFDKWFGLPRSIAGYKLVCRNEAPLSARPGSVENHVKSVEPGGLVH